jgi:hypothetical protein
VRGRAIASLGQEAVDEIGSVLHPLEPDSHQRGQLADVEPWKAQGTLIDCPRYLGNHSGMTVRESPDEHAPEDDTALLAAALDHCWAWYDARGKRSTDVINYYLVATAILITAYISAITGKPPHYWFATAIAGAGIVLTVLAVAAALHERREAELAEPALTQLQGRIAERLGLDSLIRTGERRTLAGLARAAVVMALVLAFALNAGALGYALAQAF